MDMAATAQGGHFWDTLVRNFTENVDKMERSVLHDHIERLRTTLLQQGVDMTAKRQSLTPEEMTAINKVLYPVKVQMLEGERGLEITAACYTDDHSTPDEVLVEAGFVFCWVLSTGVDIQSIDLVQTTLFRYLPSALKVGLSSNSTVRKIKLDAWDSNTEGHGACLAEGLHAGLQLEVYHTHGVDLSDQSAARVSDMLRQCSSTLTKVSLSSGPEPGPSRKNVKLLLEALIGSLKLSTLYLCNYDLGAEGGEILARVLQTCQSLKKLSIQQPDDAAMDVLVDSLHTSYSLEELGLWNNHNSTGRVALAIANVLRHNRSIKSLNLSTLNIDKVGGRALAEMLTVNDTLKELNLEMNKIGNEGAAAFVDALRVNRTLETLNLASNDIDDDTTHALMMVLQENKSFKRLSVHPGIENPSIDVISRLGTRLNNAGLQGLAKALQNGANVEKLDLEWECDFSSFYVGQVFSAIGSNRSVRELHVNGAGYIDRYAAGHLSHTFSISTTLKKVTFSYEFDDPDVVMTLLVGLSRNKSIREINFGCLYYYLIPEVLKNLFVANNTLRSFHIYLYLRAEHMVPILEGLAENYTLTNLDLGSLAQPGHELFQAQELIRRNRRLLKCAVQFVLGEQQDDEAREAYRKLSSSPLLVEEIMNRQGLCREDAAELVQAVSDS